MSILFVRHGESEANRDHRLTSDRQNPALTEKGWDDAKAFAQYWRGQPLTAVYSSPLLRARQTAQAFLDTLDLEVPMVIDERLHEIHLGAFDGQVIDDLKTEQAETYARWKQDPESPPPGGERLSAVGRRMMQFLDAVAGEAASGMVVAMTHADCLKAVTLAVLDAPWQAAAALHFGNMGGVHLSWEGDRFEIRGLPLVPPVGQ